MTMGRVAFAVVLVLFGFATEAQPCSCTTSNLPGRPGIPELGKYDFVVLGQVVNLVEVEEPRTIGGEQVSQVMTEITVRVRRAWKGARDSVTYVRTKSSGGACGYPFKLGETYLIYARGKGEPYFAHLCDPTKSAEAARDEIAALDKLMVPIYETPSNEHVQRTHSRVTPLAERRKRRAARPRR